MKNNLSKIILLCGVPASGKSTYADMLARKIKYKIECADTWRGILSRTGDESDQSNNKVIFDNFLPHAIKKHLADKKTKGVIIDVTAYNKKNRNTWLNFARENNVDIDCHWFEPDEERSLLWNSKRIRKVPEQYIKKQISEFMEPSCGEGFKNVYKIEIIDMGVMKKFVLPV